VELDVRELGESRVMVHICLDASEVGNAFQSTYQQLSNQGGIKGFRPGKVPRRILERHYDPEAIRAVTYETLLNERLREAFEQADLHPLEQVEVEVGPPPEGGLAAAIARAGAEQEDAAQAEPEQLELIAVAEETDEAADQEAEEQDEEDEEVPLVEGEPFEFHTVFTAFPRPKLPEYHGLKLQRSVTEVRDEEIDAQLDRLRQANATTVEVDRSVVGEGDLVVVDISVETGGKDEETREVELQEREIIIGQDDYDPPIDRELIGHIVGQTVEIPLDKREDHPDPSVAGSARTLRATIKSLKGRELPELTDELAQQVGDFATLEELREALRAELQEERAQQADRELREQALRYILENTEVELPEVLVAEAAERSFGSLMGSLERTGMSLESFSEATGMDEESLRANQRARAESSLKLHLALQAIAKQEEIEAAPEDIEEEMVRYAAESGAEVQLVRDAAELQPEFGDELRERVINRKLLDAIIASAEIEEVPREQPEAEDGEEQSAKPSEENPAEEDGSAAEQECEST